MKKKPIETKENPQKEWRVIGWTTGDWYKYFYNDEPLPDEAYQAVVDDIREHGYLFTGEDYQDSNYCTPVFNNYRMGNFSRRGFGGMMAEAHGHTDQYAYALYTDGWSIKEKKKKFPTGTKNKNIPDAPSIIEVSESVLERAIRETEEPKTDEVCYLSYVFNLPIELDESKGYYFDGESVTLITPDGSKGETFTILRLFSLYSLDNFDSDWERIKSYMDIDVCKFDKQSVKRKLAKHPVLLLTLRK